MTALTQPLARPDLLRDACYLDGKWVGAGDGPSIPVDNPSTGKTIVSVPKLGRKETEQAIASAQAALPAWSAKTGKERAAILLKWAQLMLAHQRDLAAIMTSEQGKPVTEAAGEIAYAASFLEWFAEEAKRIDGDILQSPKAGQRLMALKQPIGVTAAITPWNFPAAMITRKVGPALAAGCTVVIKPASSTPLTMLYLMQALKDAGVPDGVVNCVVSSKSSDVSKPILSDARLRKLTFTGSTEVGRTLLAQASEQVLRTSMELGGNAPFLVLADADVDAAVKGAMVAKYRNNGEACTAANRFYVHRDVVEEFTAKLVEASKELVLGPGIEDDTTLGPLVDQSTLDKVAELTEDAVAKGARVLTGGHREDRSGYFWPATVLGGVTRDARVLREEIFGPVAPIVTVDSDDEAVELANDTEFGLMAYVYSRDIGRAMRAVERLESGMVGLNTGLVSNPAAPFGGVKQSGLGREGSHEGIEEYLETKYVGITL